MSIHIFSHRCCWLVSPLTDLSTVFFKNMIFSKWASYCSDIRVEPTRCSNSIRQDFSTILQKTTFLKKMVEISVKMYSSQRQECYRLQKLTRTHFMCVPTIFFKLKTYRLIQEDFIKIYVYVYYILYLKNLITETRYESRQFYYRFVLLFDIYKCTV